MTDSMHGNVVEVRDDPEEGAYVVSVDGERVGKAVYHMRGGRHLFVHTEVDDAYSGMGVGSQLARFALEDVRAKGGVMVAICPFFAAFLDRHPEFDDVIDHEMTAAIHALRRLR